jgi:hypothetical protein
MDLSLELEGHYEFFVDSTADALTKGILGHDQIIALISTSRANYPTFRLF